MGRPGWRSVALVLVGVAFVLRLLYDGHVELFPEESYYWNYAQHLDIGYLDHPPMVAWLIRLGTLVLGDTELGIRVGAILCTAVAALFSYRLTRSLFGSESAVVALLLLQVMPFFFMTGLIMTPDAPLTAAWAASLYCLERALLGGQSRAWLFAGVALGLGMISKYTVGMLVPAAVLFALWDAPSRRWLLRWEPYVALVIALLIFSPVIIWNAEHGWASFAFQTSRRLAEAPRFALHKLLLSVLVLLTPTGLVTLLVSRFTRPGARDGEAGGAADLVRRRWLFVRIFTLVPLSVFFVFSLRHDVKIDWTGALWLAAVPGLAASIVSFAQAGIRGVRHWTQLAWAPTAFLFLILYGLTLQHLAFGLPGLGYSSHVELLPVGWRDLGRQVDHLAAGFRAQGAEPVIVGMDRYELASQLTFYSPDHQRSVQDTTSRSLFGVEGLMYARWFAPAEATGRPLILVAWDTRDLSDDLLKSRVEQLSEVKSGEITRGGRAVAQYYYRIASGIRLDAGANLKTPP